MKIIRFVVLVLTVEIFSCTNAQENIESICTENGGLEAWKALEDIEPDKACYLAAVTNITSTEPETSSEIDIQQAIFCDHSVGALKKCTESFLKEVKSCRKPDQHELVDVFNSIIGSTLDFLCENRNLVGDVVLSPEYRQCLDMKFSKIGECAIMFILDRDPQTFYDSITTENNLFTILLGLKLDFDSKGCSNIQKFEECSVKLMEQCEDLPFSKTLDSLFKYINNDIPCGNLNKSPKPEYVP